MKEFKHLKQDHESLGYQHKGFDYRNHQHEYPQYKTVKPDLENEAIDEMLCDTDNDCQSVHDAYRLVFLDICSGVNIITTYNNPNAISKH